MTYNRSLLFSGLVLMLFFAFGSNTVQADKIDDYLTAQIAKNHIPGLSVSVVREGKVVKMKSYGAGNLEWDAPVGPDTAFQLASATKPLVGTALLLLVQDGKVSLDEKISRYLHDSPAAWQGITLRHLATHTSGIPDDLKGKTPNTAAETIRVASELPLDHAPGERASYGITGYSVLQHILERVSGKSLPVFLQERLFKPQGMSRTGFDSMAEGGPIRTSDLIPQRAGVYEWDEGAQKQRNSSFLYGSHAYSAGGLYSSAADLSRWIIGLDTGKLLTQTSAQQMWTPQKLAGGVDGTFGIGWVIGTYRGRKTVGHSGGPALADILRFVDDKLTIVVLTNQQKMYPYLAQGVADLLVPSPPRTDVSIPDKDEKTTKSLKALLQELSAGKVDTSRFTPEAQQQFVPMLTGFALPFLRSLEPLQSLDLLEDREPEGGKTVRRYRAWYGNKPIVWMFELTPDGRVSNMSPTPE